MLRLRPLLLAPSYLLLKILLQQRQMQREAATAVTPRSVVFTSHIPVRIQTRTEEDAEVTVVTSLCLHVPSNRVSVLKKSTFFFGIA